MTPEQYPMFLTALETLAELCRDPLSELRLKTYWELMRDRVTLEEWRYACVQAMEREIQPRVPMPAILLEYALECRKLHREHQSDPPPLRRLREDLVSQEEVRRLLASVWPEERDRWAKDPIPPYEEDAH